VKSQNKFPAVVPFGKYKGQPIGVLLSDGAYNNNQILDCGIAAQPKAQKPVEASVREAAE
jgi:hypothetical protein